MQRNPSILRRLLPAFALCAAALTPGFAQAAYPEQPIKMLIAYAPGGGTDVTARLTAQYMQKYLGANASFVSINRPGAGGAIGFTELTNAAPDGYTIGFINTPNVLTIPIQRKANFHWEKYDLLGNIVDDPGNFSVHADTPDQESGRVGGLRQGESRRGHLRNHRHRLRRPPRRHDVRARGRREDDARARSRAPPRCTTPSPASRSWWRP